MKALYLVISSHLVECIECVDRMVGVLMGEGESQGFRGAGPTGGTCGGDGCPQ